MANPTHIEEVKQGQATITLWLDGLRAPNSRLSLARQRASPLKKTPYGVCVPTR
jgi:hypothetical protein